MSIKVKLFSTIAAFILVIGIMLGAVLAAEQVQVNIGGSVSFNATNVYAKVSGNISGAGTGNKTFSTLTYSAEGDSGDESDWTGLALEFTESATPIVITINVENLSEQRTLTANLENTLSASGLNITVENNSEEYSGGNVELPVSTGNDSSTTTFTLTLTVANTDTNLTDASFNYVLNLYDESSVPVIPSPVSDFTFTFNDSEKTATLNKYTGSDTNVVIPSTVNKVSSTTATEGTEYTVTALEPIPNEMAFMTEPVFQTTVESVVLPDTLTSRGEKAFYKCGQLKSISIPEGVTSIGVLAFSECRKLNSIKFGENSKLSSIGDSAFSSCDLSEIKIPANVTSIGDYAFLSVSLSSVVFDGTSKLQSIGYGAFSGCLITKLTIPSSVISIGDSAFSGCSNLSLVKFEGDSKLTSIGSNAFSSCSSLTSITIPENVTSIGSYAFDGCSSLNEVTVESDDIYLDLTSQSVCGYLISYITSTGETVKVLKSMVDSVDPDFTKNTYLNGSRFTRSVSEDGLYYVYTRN